VAHQHATFITQENMHGPGQLLKQPREVLAVRCLAQGDNFGARCTAERISRDNLEMHQDSLRVIFSVDVGRYRLHRRAR
jgi:hypothetical protein